MTKQKTKHYEPQTVADAEKVLADLEAKREKLVAFGQQLSEARRAHAYAAHVADDLVQSGHPIRAQQCPLLGVKRTSARLFDHLVGELLKMEWDIQP